MGKKTCLQKHVFLFQNTMPRQKNQISLHSNLVFINTENSIHETLQLSSKWVQLKNLSILMQFLFFSQSIYASMDVHVYTLIEVSPLTVVVFRICLFSWDLLVENKTVFSRISILLN